MQALILAGGSGTRFWPLSRRKSPKQMLDFGGTESLLQATVARLDPLIGPDSIWVCTTVDLASQVRAQLPTVPAEQVLQEPVGRNTALAIGWSVTCLPESGQDDVIVVLPADHHVQDVAAFQDSLEVAARAARSERRILTLGVLPTRPETGYGYLELGEPMDDDKTVRRVTRFTEKPDLATAERFLEEDNYLWNAGIFVFQGRSLLDRFGVHLPELRAGLEQIASQPDLLTEIYSRLPAISIDHGLMEKLDDLGTVPLDCGWTDLGSWEAIWEHLDPDGEGNVAMGDAALFDSSDSLVLSTSGTVAAVGIEGLVVVNTGDAVLVIPKSRSQEVRRIVDNFKATGRLDLL